VSNGNDVRYAASYEEARAALVQALRTTITDERVLDAIASVPRERFVIPELRHLAYADQAMPIGHGQTISQPTMVAVMLQELRLTGSEKVLEVGTGSGYQTALLARLAAEVVTVELVPNLAESASVLLEELGLENATVHLARDHLGWPEAAPYDAIVVAAAAPRVPRSLIDQLAEKGRLVIPVGSRERQELLVIEKHGLDLSVRRQGGCRFVPLLGEEAYRGG
jgi:protein-L-isoaspartate(D-aspartate) O-methyltransferase